MNHHNTVLVALDPSSDHGESALELITRNRAARSGHITLLVSLDGHTATAFRAYADSEDTTVPAAAEVYLAQVTDRLAANGFAATGIAVPGLDITADLAASAVAVGARVIAVPSGGTLLSQTEVDRVAQMSHIPVVVVPTHPVAA